MTTSGATCHKQNDTSLLTTAQATVHCLTGCVIGEVSGLIIGVSLGWTPMATMALAGELYPAEKAD
jgi:hypothetical protein